MAKKTSSIEIRRTLRLRFLTDTGKIHTINLKHASARLAGAEGPGLVKEVMERLLEYDVFTVKLVKAVDAELIERRVLLAREDFQSEESRAEGGAEVMAGAEEGMSRNRRNDSDYAAARAIDRETERYEGSRVRTVSPSPLTVRGDPAFNPADMDVRAKHYFFIPQSQTLLSA